MINLHQKDCLKFSKQFPDKYFDLVNADPPYFNGPEKRKYYGNPIGSRGVKRKEYPILDHWHVPDQNWFDEIQRVSKKQIIWGANYFDFIGEPFKTPRGNEIHDFTKQNPTGWIIWDKCNGKTSFNDYELAWTSFDRPTVIFRYMWNGMMQGRSVAFGHIQQGNKKLNQKRIHQTEKPIKLYDWQYINFTKPGDRIFSPYAGSFSDAISALKYDIEYHGCEIDKAMFKDAKRRFFNHEEQLELF